MTDIRAVTASDRAAWQPLWDAYLEFYETELPDAVSDNVFARLVAGDSLHGAIAWDDEGQAVGLVHWQFHPATWSLTSYCYLEDLYVAPATRGGGVGRALISHVGDAARAADASQVYWHTQDSNATARLLYDRVATYTGHVQYRLR